MANSTKTESRKSWHVASWPPLAWLETIIKLIAIGVGLLAFFRAWTGGVFFPSAWAPAGTRVAQLVIMIVLSLGLLVAIWDRIQERELVAMAFVILNNLGHWGLVLALASKPGPKGLVVLFAGLMLLGDLVKLVFLKVHDFGVRDTPKAVLYGLTLFYVVGYVAVIVLELLSWR